MNIKYQNQLSALSEEFDKEINKLIKNKKFKIKDSKAKRNWYEIYLRKRVFHKHYVHKGCNIVMSILDELIPQSVEESISHFADINNITLGDDNP